ncbi:hypothetical protein MIDIC_500009 [Alphaproteobacteria bacterium]
MEKLEVKLNNQIVSVVCADPKRIGQLAAAITERLQKLEQENPKVGNHRLMCLLAMMLEDEIEELRAEVEKSKAMHAHYQHQVNANQSLMQVLNDIITYIEDIVIKLE